MPASYVIHHNDWRLDLVGMGMIGIIVGEDWVAVELSPKYAKRCPKWLKLVLPITLHPKWWGEWGYSFRSMTSLVKHRGHEQSFIELRKVTSA